jgi:hypothetical protein
MQPDFSKIGPFLVSALLVFAIYRRLRRSFGRQLLRPRQMTVRIVLLGVAGCALLPMALRSSQYLWAELAGAALGVGLGVWSAERTRFLMHDGRLYYVPHTYTGIVVSLLFLGRLAFRAVQAYTGSQTSHLVSQTSHLANAPAATAAQPAQAFAPTSMVSSPLTIGIFFVLVGYYLWYYAWVLWKSKHVQPEDVEAASPAAAQ